MRLTAISYFITFIILIQGQHSEPVVGSKKVNLAGICRNVVVDNTPNVNYAFEVKESERLHKRMVDLHFVGKGNFGSVFKGMLDKYHVVVKQTSKCNLNYREARILYDLRGIKGVPQIMDCEIGFQRLYVYQQALECDMTDVKVTQLMIDKSFDTILHLFTKLSKTLLDIHSRNILHRDIKPANMMADSLEVKRIFMIDFGLSGPPELGFKAGSPFYWSPNISRKDFSIITSDDDVWALVLSMVEMTFGYQSINANGYRVCLQAELGENCRPLIRGQVEKAILSKKAEYITTCGTKAFQIYSDILLNTIGNTHQVGVNGYNGFLSEYFYLQIQNSKDECLKYIAQIKPISQPIVVDTKNIEQMIITTQKKIDYLEKSIIVNINPPNIDLKEGVEIPEDDRIKIDRNQVENVILDVPFIPAPQPEKPKVDHEVAHTAHQPHALQPGTRQLDPQTHGDNSHDQKIIGDPNAQLPNQIPNNLLQNKINEPFATKARDQQTVKYWLHLHRRTTSNFPRLLRQVLLSYDLSKITKIVDDRFDGVAIEFTSKNEELKERKLHNPLNFVRTKIGLENAPPEFREKLEQLLGEYANDQIQMQNLLHIKNETRIISTNQTSNIDEINKNNGVVLLEAGQKHEPVAITSKDSNKVVIKGGLTIITKGRNGESVSQTYVAGDKVPQSAQNSQNLHESTQKLNNTDTARDSKLTNKSQISNNKLISKI
jgi:serine/threonine protein kinase